MKVTFTGIENISTAGSEIKRAGMYQDSTGDLNIGIHKIKSQVMNFDLTGEDYSEYISILNRIERPTLIDRQNPHHITLYVQNHDVENAAMPTGYSELLLNKQPAVIFKNEDLLLYSYLAKLLKKIKHENKDSQEIASACNLSRICISDIATSYIENK